MNNFLIVSTIFIALSACLAIWAEETGRRSLVYLFKPLTTVLILTLALYLTRGEFRAYTIAILLGLAFSLAGDVFLMLPGDQFIRGLVSFLVAHFFYIFAFSRHGDFHLGSAPGLFLLYGVLIFWYLSPGLGKMKGPVIIYMLAILVMAWQAWAFYHGTGTVEGERAFAGALLFVASDSLLAIDRFRRKLPLARLWILGTYFTAQWLIALSVW